jgi:hypothetical protein
MRLQSAQFGAAELQRSPPFQFMKHPNTKCSTAGVLLLDEVRAAQEVCIKNGNVYVNYFDSKGNKIAHTSYHASGQKHFKKNGQYVYWSGGINGHWEPMKLYRTKPLDVVDRTFVSVIGWEVKSMQSVLPLMSADMIFDIPREFDIVAFETSIVSPDAEERQEIVALPVFARYRFSDDIVVEVELFGMNEELASKPYTIDDY